MGSNHEGIYMEIVLDLPLRFEALFGYHLIKIHAYYSVGPSPRASQAGNVA